MSEPGVVALRAPTAEDEDLLYRLQADLDTWEKRSPAPPAPMTLAAYRERAAKPEHQPDADFIVTVDGEAVGRTLIFHEDRLSHHAELGIALLPEARGRGIGTEAFRQTIEFAFVRRNLRRVYLWVLSSNVAAIAAYTKLGFVEEGRHREHAWVSGQYEDEVTMGLLRSEWERR